MCYATAQLTAESRIASTKHKLTIDELLQDIRALFLLIIIVASNRACLFVYYDSNYSDLDIHRLGRRKAEEPSGSLQLAPSAPTPGFRLFVSDLETFLVGCDGPKVVPITRNSHR